MTYHALTLEDFSRPSQPESSAGIAAADAEAIRLEAYESGYKSGWDDANAEAAASDHRIAADLERSLKDLSFTYEEARAEVLRGMTGLVTSILTGFLPKLAAEAVQLRVMDELNSLIEDIGVGQCRLVAAPKTSKQLDWLVEKYLDMDLQITPEPAYPDGRVTLHFSSETKEIDLNGLLQGMTEAIRDFTQLPQSSQEALHG